MMKCVYQVGQVHGGLMGVVQRAMVRSCPHVWFERAEMKDRHLVTKRSVNFFTLSGLLFHVLSVNVFLLCMHKKRFAFFLDTEIF